MTKFGKFISAFLMLLALPVQASVLLGEDDFRTAIVAEFVEQGVDENIEVEFFGGQTSFVFESAKKAKIMISQIDINEDQSKFSAKAEIFADGELQDRTMLTGKFYKLQEVYVPVRDIDKGEIITKDNLEPKQMRSNRIKNDVLTSFEQLDGKQAKKKIKVGRLIANRDVGDVIVVKKGSKVTSLYKKKGLQITASAEALEDGAKGQSIEVENTKSKKKFMAKVVDAETVEITTD
ncbi:MAG: flagellar basal body P-ring formation protein FlgA [Alphaproteobacteria bacterium]|nr:flagellar basal body P-ring formation protein FlgA [Alphaproteobacteria bacterium]